MDSCEDLQKVPINRLRDLLGEKIGTQVSTFVLLFIFISSIFFFQSESLFLKRNKKAKVRRLEYFLIGILIYLEQVSCSE